MRFRDYTLSEMQIDSFCAVINAIRANTRAIARLRKEFREFLEHPDVGVFFTDNQFNRLLEKPKARSYQQMILLLDFVNDQFVPDLLDEEPFTDDFNAIFDAYDDLKAALQAKLDAQMNPLVSLYARMNAQGQKIPKIFFNDFVGYRRSSNLGEVVRFFLGTQATPDNDKLTFSNEYYRNHHHWKVDGVGIYSASTLYLFGHAKDHRTEQGRGYRLMALQPLGIDDILSGIVLSMDEEGPIAARIILVPLSEHQLNQRQTEAKDLIDYMVRPIATDERYQFVEEIRYNLGGVLDGYPDSHIFRLISNLTLSTVRCRPRDNDRLVERELEYRRLAHQNDWDLGVIEHLMNKALGNVPSLGPKY